MNLAGRGRRRGDEAEAAEDLPGAEAAVEPIEMRHAVEQGQHRRAALDRRRDRRDGAVEVIGLAGEDDNLVGTASARRGDGLHRHPDVAERALDDETVPRDLRRAPRPYQEADVGPASASLPPKKPPTPPAPRTRIFTPASLRYSSPRRSRGC